jgi:hypothetical protein
MPSRAAALLGALTPAALGAVTTATGAAVPAHSAASGHPAAQPHGN